MAESVGALILAAGYSSRMGAFKPLLTLGGKPALRHLAEAFLTGGIPRENILVVTGHARQQLQPLIRELGIREIFNPAYGEGMFSSIQAGLRQMTAGSGENAPAGAGGGSCPAAAGSAGNLKEVLWKGILLTQADCPLPDPVTIGMLLAEAASGAGILVPTYRGKKGHPIYLPAAFFSEIAAYRGQMGLKGFLFERRSGIRLVETGDEGVVLDMDTRAEYMEMVRYLRWKEDRSLRAVQTDRMKQGRTPDRRLSVAAALKKGQRLILIRHLQQVQVGEPIFLGQTDLPLSEESRAGAAACRAALARLKPNAAVIHTSDLLRARKTAELLQEGGSGIFGREAGVEAHPFLREIHLGDWDGKTVREIQNAFPEAYEQRGRDMAGFKGSPGGENFFDLQYRALRGLVPLIESADGEDLVVVTHLGVIRMLQADWAGNNGDAPGETAPGYGEILVLEGKRGL